MYKIEELLNDFDKLYEIYQKTEDPKEKRQIYYQMFFLCDMDKRLIKERFSKLKLQNTLENQDNIELNRFNELKDLSYELSSYPNVLFDFKGYRSSKFLDRKVDYNEFNKKVLSFFTEVLPEDIELVKKTLSERLILNRNYINSQAYIMYLNAIKKYYVNIAYKNKLTNKDVRNIIHELGHVSVYEKRMYNQNDPILTELVSSLYELLYIYNYVEKNNLDKEKELGHHFYKSLGDTQLYKHFTGEIALDNNTYLGILRAFYGNIIASTLLLNNDKEELIKKMDIIKLHYNDSNGFDVLDKVGIHEDDLIYTSKNLKELVRKRLY